MKQRNSIKFQSFIDFLRKEAFTTPNKKLKKVVNSFNFLEISEEIETEQNFKEIERNINESKAIIINQYTEQEPDKYSYFVISFKQTILVIKETRIKILQTQKFI